jgi:hypothetical protein
MPVNQRAGMFRPASLGGSRALRPQSSPTRSSACKVMHDTTAAAQPSRKEIIFAIARLQDGVLHRALSTDTQ